MRDRPVEGPVGQGGGGYEAPVRVFLLHERRPGPCVRATAPRHVAHWRGLGLNDYLGDPFEDRTGGLITFSAGDVMEAQRAVETDPFVVEGLVGPS
jgi:hypothetical protein